MESRHAYRNIGCEADPKPFAPSHWDFVTLPSDKVHKAVARYPWFWRLEDHSQLLAFSYASSRAPVTASHGLIWPGSADASAAMAASRQFSWDWASPSPAHVALQRPILRSAPSSNPVGWLRMACFELAEIRCISAFFCFFSAWPSFLTPSTD